MDGLQRDVLLRLWFSLPTVIVLALNLAVWGTAGRIIVAGAGLAWLAALWTAPRPLSPKRLLELLGLLVLGSVVCRLATGRERTILATFAISAVLGGIVKFLSWWRRRPTRVQAPDLVGTIEYGSTNVSATLVQEFTADWQSELSCVMTDHAGRFELPQVFPGRTHCLMFSRPGAEKLRLEVTIAPEAPPLSVRLRLRSVYPRTLQ